MEENFRIRLEAVLDNSSLSGIKDQLKKAKFDVRPYLSVEGFAEAQKDIKRYLGGIAQAIQETWAVNDKQAMSAANKYLNTLTSGVKQSARNSLTINKELEQSYQKIKTLLEKRSGLDLTKNAKEIAQLDAQIKVAKDDFNELFKVSSKSGDFDFSSWKRIKGDIDAATRSHIAYNNAKKEDSVNNSVKSEETSLNRLIAKWEENGILTDEFNQKVKNLKQELYSIKDPQGLENYKVNLSAVSTEADKATKNMRELVDASSKIQLQNQIDRWLQQNTAATSSATAEMQGLLDMVKNEDITKEQAKQIRARIGQITNEMRAMGRLGRSFFDTLGKDASKLTHLIGASSVIMRFFREFKNGIQLVKDLDAAMTNINYTMNVSSKQLDNIGRSVVEISKELKSATSNVLGAVTLYANANETADTILEKTRTAVMLSNVSGVSAADAADMLQGVSNQFNIEQTEEGLRHISDVIQNISQNLAYDFAKGIDAINEAVSTAGATANAAGVSFESFSSMVGKTIEVTRQSGSTVGNAYKTIFSRITKASKTEATSEEDISNAEASLRAVGVQVRQANDPDNFREITDILSDLGKVWDKLDSVTQSEISYNLAGVRQTNILKSLLANWSDYEALVEKTNDAEGTALKNQEKYAESIKGKMEGLKATGESFWANVLNSGELKAGVDLLTNLLKLLDNITNTLGSAGSLGLGIGAWLGIRNVGRDKMLPLNNG